MTITDDKLQRQAEDNAAYARTRIGRNYMDLSASGQAAISRAKMAGLVWIDKHGVIKKERRRVNPA